MTYLEELEDINDQLNKKLDEAEADIRAMLSHGEYESLCGFCAKNDICGRGMKCEPKWRGSFD